MMKPLLIIVFNRPEETRRLLRVLEDVRPEHVFVAADGPRPEHAGDAQNCPIVRDLFTELPWKCTVHRLFRDVNLGCKRAVSSAITWFFENVEAGIILEDDCIPDPSFFGYCTTLLDRYATDTRIGHIGGFNCQLGNRRGGASYYFSRYYHVWGWATWRRAWKLYDPAMKDYSTFLAEGGFQAAFPDPEVRAFWKTHFDMASNGEIDTWDFQWVYTNLKNNMLGITPNTSLIQNIGFGPGATHTLSPNKTIENIKSASLIVDGGPPFVLANEPADRFTYIDHVGLTLGPERVQAPKKTNITQDRPFGDRLVQRLKKSAKTVLGRS